jgi:prepilin-type N-terminal cleavage/methylation domain-containing protein
MVSRHSRGFSLLEVIVSMSVFGVFLFIAFTLTAEMRRWEKRLPVNMLRHPQVMSVLARIRQDVLDVRAPATGIYVDKHLTYENGPKTLIIQRQIDGSLQTVVWDFTEPGVATRITWNVGIESSRWAARGLPADFTSKIKIEAVKFPGRPYGVRLVAKDMDGKTAIDQILQPRAHE